MLWRQVGVRRSLVMPMIILCLAFSTPLISPVSASISTGKTAYFEYYFCSPGGWHTYVEFTVKEWYQTENIAIIQVTNESAIQDYRVKIPEWSIVDAEGEIIGRWPYCPIWLNVSSFESGMVFNNTDDWLFGFVVDLVGSDHCEIERTIPHDGFDIIECLYYNPQISRIEQYDCHTKYPDNTVYTIRLKYYPSVWNFTSSTSTTHSQSDTLHTTPLLLAGIAVELVVIAYIVVRRSKW